MTSTPPSATRRGTDWAQSASVFVGRAAELGRLDAVFSEVAGGHPRLALVSGEAGAGKTRLAMEFADRCRRAGARVLWGRCWADEGAPPFWPWIQVLRSWSASISDEHLRWALGAGAADLAGVVPEISARAGIAPATGGLDPPQERFRQLDSIVTVLSNLSRSTTTLIVIDDLHCADLPSILVLEFLARHMPDGQLLVVGTYRDAEIAGQEALANAIGEMSRHDPVRHLPLAGLSVAAVREYLQLTLAQSAPDGTAESIMNRTEGNALFVQELVRLVCERNMSLAEIASTTTVPESVRQVIASRLRRLSEPTRHLLQVASVIGHEFDVELLAAVLRESSASLDSALDESLRAGWLTETEGGLRRCRFSHGLLRDGVYRQLAPSVRSIYHKEIAETLASRPHERAEQLAALAHHYSRASALSGAAAPAFRYQMAAAEAASRALAYEEAVEHYQAAQGLLLASGRDVADEAELLLALGTAQRCAGQPQASRTSILRVAEIARGTDNPELLARAALSPTEPWSVLFSDEGLIALLEEALERLPPVDSALRATVLAQLSQALTLGAHEERRRALTRAAVEMAQRAGDPRAYLLALGSRYHSLWNSTPVAERIVLAKQVAQMAEENGQREVALRTRYFLCANHFEAADIVSMDAQLARCTHLAKELRMPRNRWQTRSIATARALMKGPLREAEAECEETRNIGLGAGIELADAYYWAQKFMLRRASGGAVDIVKPLNRLAAMLPQLPAFRAAAAVAELEAGDSNTARALLAQFNAEGPNSVPDNFLWLVFFILLAEICHHLDDNASAKVVYNLLLPRREDIGVVAAVAVCVGSVARPLGQLATTLQRFEEAECHFQRALDKEQSMGAHVLMVQTQIDYAEMLARRGGASDAATREGILAQALRHANDLQMARFAQIIERALSRPLVPRDTPRAHATGRSRVYETVDQPNVFRREGEFWTVVYKGNLIRLRHSKGMSYLQQLLQRPREFVHVVELVGYESTEASGRFITESAFETATREPDPVIDRHAIASYRSRLQDLRAELEESQRLHDLGRQPRLRDEIEELSRHLCSALQPSGKARRFGSPVEKARVNVRNTITAAMTSVRHYDETLWRHFKGAIRTGTTCAYDPSEPTAWLTN